MNPASPNEFRYHAFGRYLRRQFGSRVHKLTIDAGFTCPNRDGTRGFGGCTFCNNSGFSPNARTEPAVVRQQLIQGIAAGRRRRIDKFIAYFQAYSNTHAPVERLRGLYDEVWRFPDIIGLSIGTRPDCVDRDKIDLIAGYTARGEIWIEYGLQSAHDCTLTLVNRCHDYDTFLRAIEMTHDRGIRICVHTILGLPGETPEMMLDTHRRLAGLPIDGIKIHLLHIMRDTVLEKQYTRGEVSLLSRPEFVSLVCDVLETLPPRVTIQRMHADAPPDVLVAPEWCLDKTGVLADIRAELARRDSWQGKALGCTLEDLTRECIVPSSPARLARRLA
jgi:radical SAM protein (TIGR01212 family)